MDAIGRTFWVLGALVLGVIEVVGRMDQSGPYQVSQPNRDRLVFNSKIHLSSSRNEVVSVVLTQKRRVGEDGGCKVLAQPPAPFEFRFYKMEKYRIQADHQSYRGARAGDYFDPLVPTDRICPGDQVWVDLNTPRQTTPGNYSLPFGISLTVWKMVIPERPTLPLYIHLNSYAVLLAHSYGQGRSWERQAQLLQSYVNTYREHRIEPYGQYFYFFPKLKMTRQGASTRELDLDAESAMGASFRQLVLKGAIAPPVVFRPDFENPPQIEQLKAIDRAIVRGYLPSDTIAYVWDEGESDPKLSLQCLSRLKWVKAHAPHLKTLVTRKPSLEFAPFVDWFVAIQNEFHPGWRKPFGLYVSCQSQGSCKDGVRARPTGPPMFVIDAPIASERAFFWINNRLGAAVGLYYNATEKLVTAWTDQSFAGGNGDGTLIYPDRVESRPNSSIRLKMLRQGSYDVEYIRWARAAGIEAATPVVDQNHWSQNWADYQKIRDGLGIQLNQIF